MEETVTLLVYWMAGIWLIGGFGAILIRQQPSLTNKFTYVASMIGALFGVIIAFITFTSQTSLQLFHWTVVQTIEFSFSLDYLSAFFLLIISVIAFIVSLYAPSYTKKYEGIKDVGLLGLGYNIFLLSMAGVVLAANGFTFLIMWETMSLVSFFLVIYEHEKASVRQSGMLYVIMTHLGTGFIIVSFLVLFIQTGTLDFSLIHLFSDQLTDQTKHIVFALALIGFGTKAGIVPIHIWLPRAHPVAPSHISALMSAVMIKTALYGLIRVIYDLVGIPSIWWGVIVLIIGMITATYGILYGVVQIDMKRFLAFSSVENMGIIFMGFGVSLIFTALNEPVIASFALLATLYHTLNHAFFKGLLFMGAGAVYQATGTRNIEKLGGLIRFMPQTAGLFLIGVLAIASLPPLNGFVSKWLTFQSLLYLPFQNGNNAWLSLLGTAGALALLFVGALVALGIIKLFGVIFLAQPRSERVLDAKEVPIFMRVSMALMGVGIILLGIFPGYVITKLQKVNSLFFPNTILPFERVFQLETVMEASTAIQPVQLLIALGIIIILILLLLYMAVGRSRYEINEPWACGISLRPDMAYSGTSLSHPLLLIFKPFFGDSFASRMIAQRVVFTINLRRIFTHLFYDPIVRLTLFISHQVRKIQDGSIHSYLAYIFLTLLIMLMIVTR